ncbi:hypothetical protein UW163_03130 [Ralstonia solanacearum]|nr:hypothetical protein UW163_03130 [Ralstonia solanacearum]AMP74547.1 hypothetical protein RALBFv3_10440 [Ralstonia solanacearum]EUJ13572.1 hypothetical protein RSP673_15165 [Ralstonia solanacearum P673]OAI69982.1 hypothetical protein RSP797_15585 [Ralstonia solanacearum]
MGRRMVVDVYVKECSRGCRGAGRRVSALLRVMRARCLAAAAQFQCLKRLPSLCEPPRFNVSQALRRFIQHQQVDSHRLKPERVSEQGGRSG